jgi:outer membrane protein assembly factor BamA
MSLAATIMLDQAMDFYGYNGYQAIFQADSVNFWQNQSNKDEMPYEYMTAFYRLDRQAISLKADFVGRLPWENWFWQGSYLFSHYRYRPIDKENINKGRPENERFPLDANTLYENYMDWGIILENEKNGGFVSAPRVGLMYDSRDFETAPSRGIWAESNLTLAPKFLGTTHQFNRYMLIWRHYIPINFVEGSAVPNEKLVFAYRLNYQGTIGHYVPYYMMPVFSTIGREWERDGLGGYRTIRGIMRGRIQALDMAFFNTELRWRFVHFQAFNQNIYLALNAFVDGGMATRYYDNSYRGNNWDDDRQMFEKYIDRNHAKGLHTAAGGGFRVVINQNFIIAVDYAKPFNKQNGNGGLYVNTGYLF